MRLIPILTAATIGLFATAAVAQNMNTTDPNSAPGASSTGGKAKRPASGEIKKMDTTDPNSAPGASATGGKPSGQVNRESTADPNSAPGASTTGAGHKSMAKSKKHKKMKKEM
jgi:hypothetical protein